MHNPPPPPATLLPEERRRLRCPRCGSANTKFCYFNNYNLSQPRHYCRDCRRYWTHGGALRNVPVGGGGTRKSSKRAASSSSPSVSPSKRPDATPSGAARPTETSPAIPLNGGGAVEPTPTLSPRAPAQEDAVGLPADANRSNGAGSLPDLSIYTPPNPSESSETSSESQRKTVAERSSFADIRAQVE